ncbi:MAG: hypothetical protein M0D55_19465 [Elusimicrobiota bacterium]|nr:MAG: hypothetical protein M0D55_19465 [Elusimicrobiota bacterium]
MAIIFSNLFTGALPALSISFATWRVVAAPSIWLEAIASSIRLLAMCRFRACGEGALSPIICAGDFLSI